MKKSELKKYAKLIVSVGANVKKNQEVVINAAVNTSELVEYVVEESYKKGAKRVTVNWSNSNLTKLDYKYQTKETLCEVFDYEHEKQKHLSKVIPTIINIGSPNPDALKGVDVVKMSSSSKVRGEAFKQYRELIEGKYQWTIATYPNENWAKKVFPDLPTKKAMKELWNAIKLCSRLDGNPIKNWEEHKQNLLNKKNQLDDLKIKDLHFTSTNGTDFRVSLLENTHFTAGGLTSKKGVYYFPNMPTEECFTTPNKYSANGVVYSSKPLSVRGNLVDNFGFKFENGKVIEVLAEVEADKVALESLINTDEGARMLGEVALVPFSSPVNQTNLLFYNTLFDENACCHLALGRGFNFSIDNYENLSKEEIKAFDLNDSLIHVDFMIGTKDMCIKATTFDDKEVQIFKDGEWSV